MIGNRLARLLTLMLFVIVAPVEAAQPLVTDDAAVLAPKTCQLEAWIRSAHDGRAYGTQPACNFTGNLELTVGGARAKPDDGESSGIVQLQAKTVLSPLGESAWSFGMLAGGGRDTGAPHGSSKFQLYYAKALASWYPRSDLEIDLNLGAANAYGAGTSRLQVLPFNMQSSITCNCSPKPFAMNLGVQSIRSAHAISLSLIALKRTQVTAIDSMHRPANGL